MGVEANGMLMYGYVEHEVGDELFSELEYNQEVYEESFIDACKRHKVVFDQVGFGAVPVLYSFASCSSGKGLDVNTVNNEDLQRLEQYKQRLHDFLWDLDIRTNDEPKWYILSYMD